MTHPMAYAVLKRNELTNFKKMERNLNALLQERNQSEKTTCYIIPTIRQSEKMQTSETVKRPVPSRAREER